MNTTNFSSIVPTTTSPSIVPTTTSPSIHSNVEVTSVPCLISIGFNIGLLFIVCIHVSRKWFKTYYRRQNIYQAHLQEEHRLVGTDLELSSNSE